MTRFEASHYIVIALWSSPFIFAVAYLIVASFRDRREARETFGCDGPVQRALLSLMRDEARR